MNIKIVKSSLICTFLVFIWLAIFQQIIPIINIDPVNEQRAKAEWPKDGLWKGLWDGSSYSTKVESYFSDHFPLRDLFLRSLGQFEYSILGNSREVIIGKEGWLSDKEVLGEQLHKLDKVDDAQIKSSILKLKQLQLWLGERGVDFLMVIIPVKPSIYPEKYPKRYIKRPAQTGLDRFQAALDKNGIPYIDSLSILKKHKNEIPVFYKTDVHWNTVGAYYEAEAIVNYFSNKALAKPIWNESINASIKADVGGELKSMALLFPQPDMAPKWETTNPSYIETVDGTGETAVKVFRGLDKNRAQLPPLLMFGNSFMLDYPSVGFHNYFQESTRVLDYQFFRQALDYIKPKHKLLILHIYETQLLFHILPPDNFNYWDKRIEKLPLPSEFHYQ